MVKCNNCSGNLYDSSDLAKAHAELVAMGRMVSIQCPYCSTIHIRTEDDDDGEEVPNETSTKNESKKEDHSAETLIQKQEVEDKTVVMEIPDTFSQEAETVLQPIEQPKPVAKKPIPTFAPQPPIPTAAPLTTQTPAPQPAFPNSQPAMAVKEENSAKDWILFGLLLFGIFILPFIFAWFTLNKKYSIVTKVVAFGWLIIYVWANVFAA